MASHRIISIGCLDAHPLWNERTPVRTGHATTTLIRAGERTILVDPGLPASILAARLAERANVTPSDVTHVFLTCFRPDVRRGLPAFEDATWWISEAEREQVGVPLIQQLQRVAEMDDRELLAALELDVAILKRCEAAPDQLAENVSLFPLPGATPGLSGLLISEARHTTLVCGDAIPTLEHLEQGQVVRWAVNVAQARESFTEALEIADLIIPGRDNLLVNPLKRPF
ncbi:MAG: MBL fold metallo-hydrolase [Planctomycetota bacterium]|nr:MBL fold metallo-hydrolase [Planctomycetota bacterium]